MISQVLLKRLRERDPAAIDEVVRAESRQIYRAARGLGFSQADAEDVTQDVLLTFLQTLGRFDGRSSVATWLYGILLNKARERRRRDGREESRDAADQIFESWFDERGAWRRPPPDLHRLMESQALSEALQRCLDTLPPAIREVFVLRQLEQLDVDEVCNLLGRTATHLGVQLHRARTRLRACLSQAGWGSSR
ncbi:MAG: sigma-70 family RNA polymerase sigma factor [Acidobacteriaceae bacterium]|jgi:RNA polymerase sigma-70 factor (ECF subfamily)|nr:sigma-70 family RNA polymerase sigma factor [Acidobacteriaceae bacterium]